ncbi:MAG: hypothetical protein HKL85_00550, partial [Acidimicrobiaceae bacterium]|nr:hypothetical protein [Acidimicrobiaceae bacterium]
PPLGSAFDPGTGVWTILVGTGRATSTTLHFSSMKVGASITFDHNGIPTIEARNDFDAMLAEGYATARYRLLEMDLERRPASLRGHGRFRTVGQRDVETHSILRHQLRRVHRTSQATVKSAQILCPTRRVMVNARRESPRFIFSAAEAAKYGSSGATLLN